MSPKKNTYQKKKTIIVQVKDREIDEYRNRKIRKTWNEEMDKILLLTTTSF